MSAYLADVERAIISEVPFDVERLARLIVEDKKLKLLKIDIWDNDQGNWGFS